jgi:hypothetical protein
MASFTQKIADFARGPKGRELAEKAKAVANKPENRAKIDQLRARLTRKGDAGPGEQGPGTAGPGAAGPEAPGGPGTA